MLERNTYRSLRSAAVAACLGIVATLTSAQGPDLREPGGAVERLLVDRTLETELVDLLEIDEDRVRFRDEHGLVRVKPRRELVAIIPEDLTWNPDPRDSVLELVGGERFTGSLVLEDNPGEMILWKSEQFGHIKTSLEFVRRVVLRESERAPLEGPPDTADALVLTNGDVLTGFLISLGRVVEMEIDTGIVEIPIARVASAHIAPAAAQGPSADGVRVWLEGGTIAAIRSIRRAPSGYELGMSHPSEADGIDNTRTPARIAPEGIRALIFDAAALRSLASIPPDSQSPLGGRRWSESIIVEQPERSILKLAAIEIPGPMRITWLLPEGAIRLGLRAELPEENWLWGHCNLVVSALAGERDGELARRTLSRETPIADLTVELPDGAESLSISIEPGRYGPIQDRVVLKRAVLLVAP